MNWIELNSIDQIEELKQLSFNTPVLIFKHSTRCGISRYVLKNFEKGYSIDLSKLQCYILDLLRFREISNQVASIFEVTHQSPQILVIKNGVATLNQSHSSIDLKEIENIL